MADVAKVLVVDTEPSTIAAVSSSLCGEYEVISASSIDECLAISQTVSPDLILLDLYISGKLNGFDAKRALQARLNQKELPILFIAKDQWRAKAPKHTTLMENEYVTLPLQKSDIANRIQQERGYRIFDPRYKDETDTPHTESDSNSDSIRDYTLVKFNEYMITNDFIKNSFYIHTYEDLANKLIEGLSLIGLECSIKVFGVDGNYEFSSRDSASNPLESAAFETMREGPRIRETESRLYLNFESIALIVKNMPVDDPGKYRRLRDYIIIMLNAAEIRLIDFTILARKNSAVIQHVQDSIEIIKETLKTVELQQTNERLRNNHKIHRTSSDIYEKLSALNLQEADKIQIVSMINNELDKLILSNERDLGFSPTIKDILDVVEVMQADLHN